MVFWNVFGSVKPCYTHLGIFTRGTNGRNKLHDASDVVRLVRKFRSKVDVVVSFVDNTVFLQMEHFPLFFLLHFGRGHVIYPFIVTLLKAYDLRMPNNFFFPLLKKKRTHEFRDLGDKPE
eukprot:Lithocolla_globosa_v1_NODE_843_length_3200_cov_8.962480.p2 type:complete len:120 gc:universal NODE_843_length_3200_cov_8.962480:727-368(-)